MASNINDTSSDDLPANVEYHVLPMCPPDTLPWNIDYPIKATPIETAANPIPSYEFGRYQIMGADRQMWIEDPNAPKCPVKPSSLDIMAMISGFTQGQTSWFLEIDRMYDPPFRILVDLERMILPASSHYHQFTICKESTNKVSRPAPNHHDLFTASGVLIVALMYRADGPMWSDIAIAQYKTRFPNDTLQHIYIDNCTNVETDPLVTMLMGGTRDDDWYGFSPAQSRIQVPTVLQYGTPAYQAILGSATGKAVAAFILGAFPRGAWRVAKIACWYYWGVNIRFDLEPVSEGPTMSEFRIHAPIVAIFLMLTQIS